MQFCRQKKKKKNPEVSLEKGTGRPGTMPDKVWAQRTVFISVSSIFWQCCISQQFAGSAEM